MKVVFIHGAPGAGKLTTARALLSRVHGRLHDNHAAIDVARTVFEFGAPGFWELVQTVRISVIDAAARGHVPVMVMTFVYVEPDDIGTFEQFEAVVEQHEGQLLPVFLQCTTDEIVGRIGNADRLARKKMTSEQGIRDFMAGHRICAVPRPTCLLLDSGANDADTNANFIIEHFRIDTR